ncbi:F-box domain protein [Rutstroemia sp. NJR-2017a WRK4]|nr:F-box domain protein [Rutstroemia sp. NJR-2017a WRK4]
MSSIGEEAPKSTTFTSRLFNALRPKASRKKLRKDPPSDPQGSARSRSQGRATGARQDHGFDHSFSYAVDEQTGERRDDTALLHGLAHHGSFDTINETYHADESLRPPGEPIIASLSARLWGRIVEYLSPCDAANLALSSKTLLQRSSWCPWIVICPTIYSVFPVRRTMCGHNEVKNA